MKLEINNQAGYKINLRLVKSVVARFAAVYKIKSSELSIAFISGAEMKKLNLTYRQINKTTDILSFSGEGDCLGELVIDYRQIKKQARAADVSVRQELVFILVHGLLHLIGYDDQTEKQRSRMIKLGQGFINKYL